MPAIQITSRTNRSQRSAPARRVTFDVVVEIEHGTARGAQLDVPFQLQQQYPTATKVEVLSHRVLRRPKHTMFSYTTGRYEVTARVFDALEEL